MVVLATMDRKRNGGTLIQGLINLCHYAVDSSLLNTKLVSLTLLDCAKLLELESVDSKK